MNKMIKKPFISPHKKSIHVKITKTTQNRSKKGSKTWIFGGLPIFCKVENLTFLGGPKKGRFLAGFWPVPIRYLKNRNIWTCGKVVKSQNVKNRQKPVKKWVPKLTPKNDPQKMTPVE